MSNKLYIDPIIAAQFAAFGSVRVMQQTNGFAVLVNTLRLQRPGDIYPASFYGKGTTVTEATHDFQRIADLAAANGTLTVMEETAEADPVWGTHGINFTPVIRGADGAYTFDRRAGMRLAVEVDSNELGTCSGMSTEP
jgi:hypothetical protein